MFPLVLPTTTLCAEPPAATGFQGGSEQRGRRHRTDDAANCATKNNLPTAGDQGGRRSLVLTANDARHITPEDVALTNTSAAEEPLRRASRLTPNGFATSLQRRPSCRQKP